ncbi:hypothetical protein Bca4012_010043 [Brassica carinata]
MEKPATGMDRALSLTDLKIDDGGGHDDKAHGRAEKRMETEEEEQATEMELQYVARDIDGDWRPWRKKSHGG